jgi:hypothetical protein
MPHCFFYMNKRSMSSGHCPSIEVSLKLSTNKLKEQI